MANDRKNATVLVLTPCSKEVTSLLNYATIKIIFRLKENSRQETKQFCYFFLFFIKVAANW